MKISPDPILKTIKSVTTMRGTLFVVSLILIFTTLTEGSAFHHHARTRKQMKNSFNSALKPELKGSLGKYLYTEIEILILVP